MDSPCAGGIGTSTAAGHRHQHEGLGDCSKALLRNMLAAKVFRKCAVLKSWPACSIRADNPTSITCCVCVLQPCQPYASCSRTSTFAAAV
jgi:hypothetical protein